jgi:signal transduction histidine kinase
MEFKVIDTGIGVPEDAKDKLFTKFFRADNAREQSPNGTGIGLYLVKRVVADQKGSIIFSSQSGKGSTFGFTLPLHAELPKEFTTDTQSETSSTGEVKPPTLVQ